MFGNISFTGGGGNGGNGQGEEIVLDNDTSDPDWMKKSEDEESIITRDDD